jgi:hypothetical protein
VADDDYAAFKRWQASRYHLPRPSGARDPEVSQSELGSGESPPAVAPIYVTGPDFAVRKRYLRRILPVLAFVDDRDLAEYVEWMSPSELADFVRVLYHANLEGLLDVIRRLATAATRKP